MARHSDNIVSFQSLKERKECSIYEEGLITISVYKTNKVDTPFFFIEPDRRELLPIVDQLEKTLSNYHSKA